MKRKRDLVSGEVDDGRWNSIYRVHTDTCEGWHRDGKRLAAPWRKCLFVDVLDRDGGAMLV